MHITNQKLSLGNVLNIFMEHDLNISMIYGIKEKCIILTHTIGYCYKYTCAAYDCFSAPGSEMTSFVECTAPLF